MNMQLDAKVLQLFPKLNPANASDITEKKRTLQKLACLKTIGDKGPISGSELATKLKVPRSEANKITKDTYPFFNQSRQAKSVSLRKPLA
jgi:DNA-binding MarR family transcriptional regulator